MFNFGGKIETKLKFTVIGDASCGKTSLKNGIDKLLEFWKNIKPLFSVKLIWV